MKVKAIVKTESKPGAEYTSFEIPEMGPDDVLVKVKAAAICGTDVHICDWNEWAAQNFVRAYGGLPRVLGHDFAGEIVKVAREVANVTVGDRIAAETHIPCRK
jgi:threonine 3-dehydrogenase